MRPATDRVEVPILNWGLAGYFDPQANKYPGPTGGGKFGPGTEFSETSALSTVSECRFRIVVT
ncbi:hypothetical protein Taro_033321 [Colocasia esculenta]|uniref:Uncharacterized protein n=1 Tax=Colocasia esculenta TaxID=4460 RepID=A0A843W8Q0_COLES|nr:hypothetical protein [Colocasia esculenta]